MHFAIFFLAGRPAARLLPTRMLFSPDGMPPQFHRDEPVIQHYGLVKARHPLAAARSVVVEVDGIDRTLHAVAAAFPLTGATEILTSVLSREVCGEPHRESPDFDMHGARIAQNAIAHAALDAGTFGVAMKLVSEPSASLRLAVILAEHGFRTILGAPGRRLAVTHLCVACIGPATPRASASGESEEIAARAGLR